MPRPLLRPKVKMTPMMRKMQTKPPKGMYWMGGKLFKLPSPKERFLSVFSVVEGDRVYAHKRGPPVAMHIENWIKTGVMTRSKGYLHITPKGKAMLGIK